MNTIAARVVRDGQWWVVTVPIAGDTHLTQGHTLAQAQQMAEDLVRLWARRLDDPGLADAVVTLEVDGSAKQMVDRVTAAQASSAAAARRAREAQVDAVAALRREGISTQDIATLMGISRGRVSQLAHA